MMIASLRDGKTGAEVEIGSIYVDAIEELANLVIEDASNENLELIIKNKSRNKEERYGNTV